MVPSPRSRRGQSPGSPCGVVRLGWLCVTRAGQASGHLPAGAWLFSGAVWAQQHVHQSSWRRARNKCCTRGNASGSETLAVPAGQKGTPRVRVCPVMTEVDVHAEAIESQSCYPASRSDGRRWRDEPVNVGAVAFWGTATSALCASQATETCRRPAAAEIGLARSFIRPRPLRSTPIRRIRM